MLARKSWTAYAAIFLITLLPMFVALALKPTWPLFSLGLGVGTALYAAHKTLATRSYRFYLDDHGVWLASGYLPWKKGVWGMQWRDLGQAGFLPSFTGWLFRSYTVVVSHRFTRSRELRITQMHNGQKSASEINMRHKARVQTRTLG
jgi:hypothetical protein